MSGWQIAATVVVALIAIATVYGFTKLGDPKVQGAGTTPASSIDNAVVNAGPAQVYALWIGDSYTAGAGSGSEEGGYTYGVSSNMGWMACLDTIGGTSYKNPGEDPEHPQNAIARLSKDESTCPGAKIVIVDEGRNDHEDQLGSTLAAAHMYLTALRKAYPHAHIVVIDPFYVTNSPWPTRPQYIRALNGYAKAISAKTIDPYALKWFDGLPKTDVDDDGVHPTAPGYALITRDLSAELRKLGVAQL